MRTLRILFAKELSAILASPIGYTVAAVFLLVLGLNSALYAGYNFINLFQPTPQVGRHKQVALFEQELLAGDARRILP